MSEQNNIKNLRSGFDTYWNQTLKPFLEEKEQVRKKYLSHFFGLLILAFLLIPIVSIGSYALWKMYSYEIDSGPFLMLLALLVFILQRPYHHYKKNVKNDVMPVFAQYFQDIKYCQNQGLSVADLKESYLFPEADKYTSDDCFEGSYKNVSLQITEELLQKISYTQKKRHVKTLFQGIIIQFQMNKNFQGHTIVLKDAGFFNRFKKFPNLERVTLENPIFEKKFEVYSSDQVEARYLLTPLFMERIEQLKTLYKGKSVELSFLNNHVLIAIETNQDMFEPLSFFKSNINEEKIKRVLEQFLNIFSIIEILKLTERTGI